ncbi:acyl-CoA dehydrogenase family protein [Williamsia maris]|uniref:Acyl-CoA dehydrogenase n=1 Tax=Williamsia maris TaxID=72806 RepID=A0ABT1HA74_9NOCA|nr:acyl-CoA dehydrogenase family protein [Williamsia maris]MCP2175161.1 hypothetical protein [Williamsia maris]
MTSPVITSPGIDTDDQADLRGAVRDVLRRHGDSPALRSAMAATPRYDRTLWSALAEQIGVAALAIPERFGGVDASLMESHVVLEELGRTLSPVPMLGSAVLAAQAVLLSRDDEACERVLPAIAAGESIAALCWADAAGWDEPGVRTDGGLLTGTAHYVLDAEYADVLIVVARSGGHVTLHEVSRDADGVVVTALPTMDPTRPLSSVGFDDTPSQTIAAPADLLRRLRTVAAVALSAEQVGAARAVLDQTVEYTSSRRQFGRVIGSFQALKHRMADMYAFTETARSISYAAAGALVADDPDAAELAAAARVYCSQMSASVAGEAVQLHGGIGITWEHDVQLYFKRAHGAAQLFGQPSVSMESLARAAGL